MPPTGCRAPTAQTPEFVGSSDDLRVLTTLWPDAPLTASAPLRAAQIIATILRAAPSLHARCQRNCHAACCPPPGGSKLDLCSGSEGTPGSLRVGQVGSATSLALAPAQSARGLGKERERCSLAARRAAHLCCAEAGG